MPSIPKFSIAQDESTVTVTIKVPFIRVSGAETFIDGPNFNFSCPPYLLKLCFPGNLLDTEEDPCVGTYDPNDDHGTLTCILKKERAGENFPDLDLTTKLMQERTAPRRRGEVAQTPAQQAAARGSRGPLIEVVSSTSVDESGPDSDSDGGGEEGASTSVADYISSLPPPPPVSQSLEGGAQPPLLAQPKYGFNGRFAGVLSSLREELQCMCTLPDVDNLPASERRPLRTLQEKEAFCTDRYQSDFWFNSLENIPVRLARGEGDDVDPVLSEALAFKTPFEKEWEARCSDGLSEPLSSMSISGATDDALDTSDSADLASIPNREHLLTPIEKKSLLLGIVDIIFAYCYDRRLTCGEPNVESAWTSSILSPTLACFEVWIPGFDGPADVLAAAARRSLIFPYLRFLPLTRRVAMDVMGVLMGGRRAALRCFLAVRRTMEASDTHYMLNRLYIDDYCLFLQRLGEEEFQEFVRECVKDFGERLGGAGFQGTEFREAMALGLEELENEVIKSATEEVAEGEGDDEEEAESEEEEEDDEEVGKGGGTDSGIVKNAPLIEEVS